ncbi:MAG: HEAT repeat domain-containing protein [Planctomycetota bacterium]
MRRLLLACCLCAGCATSPRSDDHKPPAKAKEAPARQADDVAIERKASDFADKRTVPRATDSEISEFHRIWELFRRNDGRWPLERDRFKRRSDAAAYLLAGYVLAYYTNANIVRERVPKHVVRAKNEIVAVGEACVPLLIDMMVLDKIPLMKGRSTTDARKAKYWIPDDITRQDCLDMLERIGAKAVPALLQTVERKDLGVKGRRLTALALGGTRDARAYGALVDLLKSDPSWQVRADAATGLGKLGDRRAVQPLAEAVRTDPDPAVVKRADEVRRKLLRRRT